MQPDVISPPIKSESWQVRDINQRRFQRMPEEILGNEGVTTFVHKAKRGVSQMM